MSAPVPDRGPAARSFVHLAAWRRRAWAALCLLFAACLVPAFAASVTTGFNDRQLGTGLTSPTAMSGLF